MAKTGRPPKDPGVVSCTYDDGVTPELIALADKRIKPLLHSWRFLEYDMIKLLICCYLQGCRDTAESMVNKGWVEPKT